MKAIAYSSPFVPPEWIAAHGLQPRRLRLARRVDRPLLGGVAGRLPVCRCVARRSRRRDRRIGAGADHGLRPDALRGRVDRPARRLPGVLLNVPSTWQTPTSRQLYRDELRRLGRFLVELGGRQPSHERLADVMRDLRAARRRCVPSGRGSPRQIRRRDPGLRDGDTTAAIGKRPCTSRPTESARMACLAFVGGPLLADGLRRLRRDRTGRRARRARRHREAASERCRGPFDPRTRRRRSAATNWPTPISTASPTPSAGRTAGSTSGSGGELAGRQRAGIVCSALRVVRPVARRVAATEAVEPRAGAGTRRRRDDDRSAAGRTARPNRGLSGDAAA